LLSITSAEELLVLSNNFSTKHLTKRHLRIVILQNIFRPNLLSGLGDENDGVDPVVWRMVLPQPHEVLVRLGL